MTAPQEMAATTGTIECPLPPDSRGRYVNSTAIVPAITTGRCPSRTATGFYGDGRTKHRPSGYATERYATINLSDEEDEGTLAHVAPVANGEESADKRVTGTGEHEMTQHSTRRKHRPLSPVFRHGTQQPTSRPRRRRILGSTIRTDTKRRTQCGRRAG